MICGDFNYPKIDWNNNLVNAALDSKEQHFYDTSQNNFLFQHVDEFTRQRGSDTPSMLDLIFSKNNLEIENILYRAPLGLGDHSVLVFDFILEGNIEIEEVALKKKKYFQTNYLQMNAFFQETDWLLELSGKSLQGKWDFLLNKYNFIVEELVPVGLESGGDFPKPKWLTKVAKQSIKIKHEAWDQHRKSRKNRSYQNYVTARNKSVDAIRKAKYSYEKSVAREVKRGDKAVFYAYARSQTSIKEEFQRF